MTTVIHLFHRDLRLEDNVALQKAVEFGDAVVPLYIHDTEVLGGVAEGQASLWWLHHSLTELDNGLREHGSRLILRRGSRLQELLRIIEETGAEAIFFNRRYVPWLDNQDSTIARELSIPYKRFRGYLLFEPEAIKTKTGTPFRVFTPFYKACLAGMTPYPPAPKPLKIPSPSKWPQSNSLSDLAFLPSGPDWSSGLRENWKPGEAGAKERIQSFSKVLGNYQNDRDRPDLTGTSRLSPHLHFGEISPRSCWNYFLCKQESEGKTAFLRELIWREFSYHLLVQYPDMALEPLQKKFKKFPWNEDKTMLTAWERGETGYPIVDAGMRQMWETGWMHNRVRMVVASFLIKHLLLDWRGGHDWFWDTLVDADPANNAASWQWVAGCGADAAPFFRIFNPMAQGSKFDPKGDYVRRWIPEIGQLPSKYIHQPWLAPKMVLETAGIKLGLDYPRPIVDHKIARERALDSLASIKGA